ncbi:PKD domain-containing protein [candidate division WOR-3 bacterium]|uniref:PKD domain-containing protein n=1 Tax=candidate division WOR-3 bacterium TaxID=2052148 RepID=A0A9D5QCG9_UNCW3|nr:PKD domain-containing protein [candidate division WOR-3 bacterium]MBD3363971.1 PKD domain-containing protein [candidate division WOR-3 bacterium]
MNSFEKKRKISAEVVGLLLFVISTSFLFAEPVNPGTAAQVAEVKTGVINYTFDEAKVSISNFRLAGSTPDPLYSDDNELLAWVFDLAPEGFIVVTGNTDLVPVIAYSTHGSFPWDEDPNNIMLYMLRTDIDMRMSARDALPHERIEENHLQWEEYLSGNILELAPGDSWPPEGQTSTGGWVELTWHQGSPYNADCPIDPATSNRCVVGCVATAMSMIVAFWQYTESVTFTSADDYLTYTRNIYIDATTASIPSIDYNNGSPSNAMAAAISYACGVSVQMDYTSQGSGAITSDCANALKTFFDFISADPMEDYLPDFYPTLEQNMKDSMPAQLSIEKSDGTGDHSIVCDGFREPSGGGDDEWHLNFGWGGGSPDPITSAWYVLPEGMPGDYSVIKYGVVNIEAPERPGAVPVADFSGDPRSGTAALTVYFTDLSSGNPTEWEWDFGDSRTSTTQNPTHVYEADGSYTVSLTVRNSDGEDTEVKADYISVGASAPTAEFSGAPTSGDAPLTVNFTDESTGEITDWSWEFGDGNTSTTPSPGPTHEYTDPGTYTVSLTVSNPYGSDTRTRNDYINVGTAPQPPSAEFSASPTSGDAPLVVNFTDESTGNPDSWSWDFGDGGTSTDQDPSYTYNSGGTYTVSLTATNAQGSNTETKSNYITVNELNPPVAAFIADPSSGYVPFTHRMTVQFRDESTEDPEEWAWNFGDGGTSTEQNPTHTYTSAGSFEVTLTATNGDGSDTATDTVVLASLPSEYFILPAMADYDAKEVEVKYGAPSDTKIEIFVYNVSGQLVRRLLTREIPRGEYTAIWDLTDERRLPVSPGVYFLELRADDGGAASKIVIAR